MHRGGSKVCQSNLFTIRLDKKTANERLLNCLAFFGILNLKKTNPLKIRDKMLSKWKYWTLLSVSYWLNIMSQLSAPICLCHAILRPCSRKRWPQTRYPCVLRKTWNFDLSLTWGGKTEEEEGFTSVHWSAEIDTSTTVKQALIPPSPTWQAAKWKENKLRGARRSNKITEKGHEIKLELKRTTEEGFRGKWSKGGGNTLHKPLTPLKFKQLDHFCVSSSRLRFVRWACRENKYRLVTRRECFTQILIHSHVVYMTDSAVYHVYASAPMMRRGQRLYVFGVVCPSSVPFSWPQYLGNAWREFRYVPGHERPLGLGDELMQRSLWRHKTRFLFHALIMTEFSRKCLTG